ncbi:MAG: radical SAM family heme chaperone HemW [Planctomycetota bacterium]
MPAHVHGSPTSLYVHVPFCVVKCGYCDFNSFTADGAAPLDRYLDALSREMVLADLPRDPVSVFIGGGTPSYLDEARLERLLAILTRHVDLHRCPEVTMEANPESVTSAKASLARSAGVRRVSMGAQSFDDHFLRLLDRAHDARRTVRAVAELRTAGVDNVNLDLIFALPGQTLGQWQSDLEAALALTPEHLSCYSLTFEPGTRFFRDLRQGRMHRSDEDVDRAMFLHTRARLADAGYDAYEISNFAGRGGPCRHNDHYWLQGDYVGVGPGAASHRRGVRWTNLKSLEAWADALARGLPPVAEAETLTPRQRTAEALWLGLRRRDGVDLAQVAGTTGVDAERAFAGELDGLIEAGLLTRQGVCIRLSHSGLLVADEIGARILRA